MKASPHDLVPGSKALTQARCVLLFGSNPSLGEALKDGLLSDFAAEEETRVFAAADLRKQPGAFLDGLADMGLFASRQASLVKEASDALTKTIEQAAEALAGRDDRLLVLQAGGLGAASKLRKAAEASRHMLAVACYEESPEAIVAFIKQEAGQRYNRQLSDAAAQSLRALVGDDRLLIRSALASCDLYALDEPDLTPELIEACLVSTAASSLDQALQATFDGRPDTLAAALGRFEGDASGLLIACQRHALRLAQVRAGLDGGGALDGLMARLRPPVFWKQKASFSAQVRAYPASVLSAVSSALLEASYKARAHHESGAAFIAQSLMSVAQRLARVRAQLKSQSQARRHPPSR